MKRQIPSALAIFILVTACASSPAVSSTPAPSPAVPASAPAPAQVNPAATPNPTPPAPAQTAKPAVPPWTTHSTGVEGSNLVFVLSGPAKSDVPALALQSMRAYLNLPIAGDTPPEAAQAVQKFLQKMSATPPSDKFAHDSKGWWEIVVSNDQWMASRAQLQQLFHPATADPSVRLELSADDLLAHGSYFEAVAGYVAAAAATVTGQTVLPDRFKAILDKVHQVLAKFTLSTTSPAQASRVGEPFPSPVQVHLNYGTDPGSPSIANASLRISYKTKVNGHVAITGQSVVTDAQGGAQFALPTPDFAVRDNLTVLVDVNPWLEALASAPKDLRDSVADLENLAGAARLQLPYTVQSASKLVPMIVALADLDEKGGLLRRQDSTAALIAALQKAGFISSGVQVNLSLLKSPNDNVILTAWKFQGKSTGRAVYGTVSVVSVTPNGNQFDAEVLGSVKVADLATNKPVFQQKTSKVATGPDRASAISLALKGWSADAAATMDDSLP